MLVDSRFQKRGEEAKSATTRSMVVLNSSVVENLPRPLSGNLRRPRKKARRNLSTIHPDTEKLKRRLKQKFAYLRFVKHEKDPRSVAYPTARRSAAQLQGLMLPFSSKVQKKRDRRYAAWRKSNRRRAMINSVEPLRKNAAHAAKIRGHLREQRKRSR